MPKEIAKRGTDSTDDNRQKLIKFISTTNTMSAYTVVNNEQEQQLQIHLDGQTALLEYRFYKGAIALMHTEVPDILEGKGMASSLATAAFDYAREQNKKVRVYCAFVRTFLEKHPEYLPMVER